MSNNSFVSCRNDGHFSMSLLSEIHFLTGIQADWLYELTRNVEASPPVARFLEMASWLDRPCDEILHRLREPMNFEDLVLLVKILIFQARVGRCEFPEAEVLDLLTTDPDFGKGVTPRIWDLHRQMALLGCKEIVDYPWDDGYGHKESYESILESMLGNGIFPSLDDPTEDDFWSLVIALKAIGPVLQPLSLRARAKRFAESVATTFLELTIDQFQHHGDADVLFNVLDFNVQRDTLERLLSRFLEIKCVDGNNIQCWILAGELFPERARALFEKHAEELPPALGEFLELS